MSRPVTDGSGNPVLCQEAVAARDALIEKLAALPPVQAALEQILHRFGEEAVAEVSRTARGRIAPMIRLRARTAGSGTDPSTAVRPK